MRKRKFLNLLLALTVTASAFMLTACDGEEYKDDSKRTVGASAEGVDEDLTRYNSETLMIAQIQKIQTDPEEYIGKTIRIKAPYSVFTDTNTGNVYHSAYISPDNTSCCMYGFEFLIEDDSQVTYPAVQTKITVTGVLNQYVDVDGQKYLRLENATMKV